MLQYDSLVNGHCCNLTSQKSQFGIISGLNHSRICIFWRAVASETHVYELKLLSLSTLMRVGLKVYIQNCGLGVWKGDLEKKDARTIMVCYIEYVCTEPIPTSFSILECKISFKEKKTASSVEQKAVALSCKSLSWSFFFQFLRGNASVSESQNFWMAGWVYKISSSPQHMSLEATCLSGLSRHVCTCSKVRQLQHLYFSSWRAREHKDSSSSWGPSSYCSSPFCWCRTGLQRSSQG